MPDASLGLPFEINEEVDPTLITGRARIPLVIELFRHLGVPAMFQAPIRVQERQRGL